MYKRAIATQATYLPPVSWSSRSYTMRRDIVEGWMFWAVFELAKRRTDDVVTQVRAAQRACDRIDAD